MNTHMPIPNVGKKCGGLYVITHLFGPTNLGDKVHENVVGHILSPMYLVLQYNVHMWWIHWLLTVNIWGVVSSGNCNPATYRYPPLGIKLSKGNRIVL